VQAWKTCSLSLLVAIFAACEDGGIIIDTECNPACNEGQVCKLVRCVIDPNWEDPKPQSLQSAEDTDCDEDAAESCVDGVCRTPRASCANSNDCAADEVCIEGTCERPDDLCSPACDNGQFCIRGTCRTEWPTSCNNNDDCTPAEECLEDSFCHLRDPNLCENGGGDCPTGESCVRGTCQTDCTNSTDCDMAAGELCIDGTCQIPDTDSCFPGCPPWEVCINGSCLHTSCMDGNPCAGSAICRDSTDCDMAAGELCIDGTCQIPDPDSGPSF
jgi:hypothetical protein